MCLQQFGQKLDKLASVSVQRNKNLVLDSYHQLRLLANV
uniref:Uncharacterized protein n=1 Tax=Arundo donax TaxID=35708 RepID=A0A0A9G276_ARUDO